MIHDVDYWRRFHAGDIPAQKAILDFLCKRQSVQVLEGSNVLPDQQRVICCMLLDALLHMSLESLPKLLHQAGCLECVSAANVPQFSNFASALIYLPKVLDDCKSTMTYQEVGYAIHQDCASDSAAKKYGENHAKLAMSCGLAVAAEKEGQAGVKISLLGSAYCEYDAENQLELIARLCYRIPIIQRAVISQDRHAAIEEGLQTLSESTRKRRRHNAYELLDYALNE